LFAKLAQIGSPKKRASPLCRWRERSLCKSLANFLESQTSKLHGRLHIARRLHAAGARNCSKAALGLLSIGWFALPDC
jgi:hypothetical protein